MDKGLLTLKETSSYVSMGESTISRDVRLGNFPLPVWVGSNKYWRRMDIDAWIASLSTEKKESKKENRGRKRLSA